MDDIWFCDGIDYFDQANKYHPSDLAFIHMVQGRK